MLELINFQCLLVFFNSFSFFFYPYLMIFFIAFRERERKVERERHGLVDIPFVLWPGNELTT